MSTPSKTPDPKAPPTFIDSAKPPRTWTLDLSLDLCDQIRAATQFDPLPDDNDPAELINLSFQRQRLADVLWECCQAQAASKEIDRKSFRSGMDGKALGRGWEALVLSIRFFIQSQNQKQAEQFDAMFEAAMRLAELGMEKITKTVGSDEIKEGIREAVDDFAKMLPAKMQEALASSVTGSQELQGSALARFRSAS